MNSRILKQLGHTVGFKGVVLAARLLLIYMLAHVFTPADFGAYALVTTMNSFGVFLLGLNLYNYVYRAAPGKSLEQRTIIFKSTLCFEMAVATTLVILILATGALFPLLRALKASEYHNAFIVGLVLLIGLIVLAEVQHYLWAKTEIEHNNRLDIIQHALWVFPLLLLWRLGVSISVAGLFAANLAGVILAVFYGFAHVEKKEWWHARPDVKVIREALIFSIPMIVPAFSEYALRIADRVILSSYRTLYEVGLYSFACSFLSTLYSFTAGILLRTVIPHVVEAHNHGNIERRNLLLTYSLKSSFLAFAGAALLFLMLARPILGLLARGEYLASIRVMPLVALGYAMLILALPAHYLLMLDNRTTLLMFIDLVGMTVGLCLDFVLVPKFSYYGAAIATILGFGSIAVLKNIYSQFWRRLHWADLFSLRMELRFVAHYFGAGLPAGNNSD